jgi:hypothetical protein
MCVRPNLGSFGLVILVGLSLSLSDAAAPAAALGQSEGSGSGSRPKQAASAPPAADTASSAAPAPRGVTTAPSAAPAPSAVTTAPTAFSVRYMMRDMETIARVLQLDSTQTSIVEAMLADYLAETGVSRPVHEYPALAERFRANVQAVLSEEQFAKWPEVDAAVRRSRLAVGATLPGEGIDVIGLLSDLIEPKDREAREFIAASAEYSSALDPLLSRRTELLDAIRASMGRATSAETMRSLVAEVGSVRASIRDLNVRTVERIATLLPPERGPLAVDALRRASYPSVFSAGEAESLVRRAREDAASDAELRANIDLIAEALESRLADARARAIEAVRVRGEFAAGIAVGVSADQVDERIKESESELMKVDDWVIDTLVVEMPERTGLGTQLRQEIDGRDRYRRLREAKGWGNEEATRTEFDSNGDGQLDAAEADMAFRTYTRNVSRFAKYRL